MKLVLAVVKPFKVAELVDAFSADATFPGMTVVDARGFGREKTRAHRRGGAEDVHDFTAHALVLIAAPDDRATPIVERVTQIAHTGQPGDGKIFVLPLEAAVAITRGEQNDDALR